MQNLLPLLLRPLRLVISTQHLRNARIVLLKATHWPFVALILFYERALSWLHARKTGPSGVSNRTSLNSPTSLRRPLSRRTLASGRPPSLVHQPRERQGRSSAARESPAATESVEGLSSAVAALQTQVAHLSDLLHQERQRQQGSRDDV